MGSAASVLRAVAACVALAALVGCDDEEESRLPPGTEREIRKTFAEKGMKVTTVSPDGRWVYTEADPDTPESVSGAYYPAAGYAVFVVLLLVVAAGLGMLLSRLRDRMALGALGFASLRVGKVDGAEQADESQPSYGDELPLPPCHLSEERAQVVPAVEARQPLPPQEAPMDGARLLELLQQTEDGTPVFARIVGLQGKPKPSRIWFYDKLETERRGFKEVCLGMARVRRRKVEGYYVSSTPPHTIAEFVPFRVAEEVPRGAWLELEQTTILLRVRRPKGFEVCLWLDRVEPDTGRLICYRKGDLSARPNYTSPRPVPYRMVVSVRLLDQVEAADVVWGVAGSLADGCGTGA